MNTFLPLDGEQALKLSEGFCPWSLPWEDEDGKLVGGNCRGIVRQFAIGGETRKYLFCFRMDVFVRIKDGFIQTVTSEAVESLGWKEV